MNKAQKIIKRLDSNGLLDSDTSQFLRRRLRERLESEAKKQEKEIVDLKKEITIIKTRILS